MYNNGTMIKVREDMDMSEPLRKDTKGSNNFNDLNIDDINTTNMDELDTSILNSFTDNFDCVKNMNVLKLENDNHTIDNDNMIDIGKIEDTDEKKDTDNVKDTDVVKNITYEKDTDIINIKNVQVDFGVDSNEGKHSGTDKEQIKKKRIKIIIKSLRILCIIGFAVFLYLFIDEVLIQPYKMKKTIEIAKDLYHYGDSISAVLDKPVNQFQNYINTNDEIYIESETNSNSDPTPTPDSNRDEMGRLIKFKKLLEINEDVKGWIRIDNINGENDTKIDYVVVQSSSEDPEFYLSRDWATKEYLKAGSIFLDITSSVETNTKNLVIYGHNMTSSDDMFHYLLRYKELDFLKEHPIINFDTIYEEGLWKVFAVFITPGNNEKGDFFRYNRSTFQNDRDFLEFIYHVRIRSLFNIDDVDINENDQILTLSTCSYELYNYRIIIVARRIREGEDITVDTGSIKKNKNVLYPESFYKQYGGKAPKIPSFDEALKDGLIPWYNPTL